MRQLMKAGILLVVIAVTGSTLSALAQKVAFSVNSPASATDKPYHVKVFENGEWKYDVDEAQGVTYSVKMVAMDSTGSLYISYQQGGGVRQLNKYTPNVADTAVFRHSQALTSYGGIGGQGQCVWGMGNEGYAMIDLTDEVRKDSIVMSGDDAGWVLACPSPGARTSPYSYIARLNAGKDGAPRGFGPKTGNTAYLNIEGLPWNNIGDQNPADGSVKDNMLTGLVIDQINGEIYATQCKGTYPGYVPGDPNPFMASNTISRFSPDFTLLSHWGANDRNSQTNVMSGNVQHFAVTQDGSVWFSTQDAHLGLWSFPNRGLVKYDSQGNFITKLVGPDILSGTARDDFYWDLALAIDENDDLWVNETDRIMKLDSGDGHFIEWPLGDTTGQNDTSIHPHSWDASAGGIRQMTVGPLPPVGSSIRIQ